MFFTCNDACVNDDEWRLMILCTGGARSLYPQSERWRAGAWFTWDQTQSVCVCIYTNYDEKQKEQAKRDNLGKMDLGRCVRAHEQWNAMPF